MSSASKLKSPRLGEELVILGLLRPDHLEVALAEQKRTGRPLGRVLVANGFASEEAIAATLAAQIGVRYVDLQGFELNAESVRALTEIQARRLRALVLEDRGAEYVVGFVDPFDLRAQDEIAALLKRPIEVALIGNEQFVQAADRIYRKTAIIAEIARTIEGTVGTADASATAAGASEDAPVVKLLQTLFEDAVQARTSDIHLEPQKNKLIVRFRVDGVLQVQSEMDSKIAPPLAVRLKLMAGLDIGEKRLPQDGRLSVQCKSTALDVRMSTVPTQYGESIVLRILIVDGGVIALDKSGMKPATLEKFERLIRAEHGIVLVTGPTGSGKTTTLYGALQAINRPGVKILTCEDPVEYRMDGLTQVQVNDKIDLSFARVLRSFLRQDPDVILVGEIRDRETAEIATRAALTGHLVLSTLHTNSAIGTPSRLMDLGLPPYMVASSLLGVLAQRLLRTVCEHCAAPYTPSPNEIEWIRYQVGGDFGAANFRSGKGCERCNGVGFLGRTGVYELILMTAPLAEAIQSGDTATFEQEARAQVGDNSLNRQVLGMLLSGQTTIQEANGVVTSSELIGEAIDIEPAPFSVERGQAMPGRAP